MLVLKVILVWLLLNFGVLVYNTQNMNLMELVSLLRQLFSRSLISWLKFLLSGGWEIDEWRESVATTRRNSVLLDNTPTVVSTDWELNIAAATAAFSAQILQSNQDESYIKIHVLMLLHFSMINPEKMDLTGVAGRNLVEIR